MTNIHSCSYYCERPECIRAQRDELRDELAELRERTRWRSMAIPSLVGASGLPH